MNKVAGMNYVKSAILISGLALLGSCSKIRNREMVVIRDCTGTYLRLEGKDYQVCNISSTNNYPDGSMVRASFKATGACSEVQGAICELYHASEGRVKITDIEQE